MFVKCTHIFVCFDTEYITLLLALQMSIKSTKRPRALFKTLKKKMTHAPRDFQKLLSNGATVIEHCFFDNSKNNWFKIMLFHSFILKLFFVLLDSQYVLKCLTVNLLGKFNIMQFFSFPLSFVHSDCVS